MSETTLLWHDYETFGIDPRRDRAAQFAAVRTDSALNVIAPPICLFCKVADDYLPQPEACAITGISPQHLASKGLNEADFTRQLHQQLITPNTCTLGYNTIRFDDEVTRNLLYRNFYDPYAREWQNGNSRWDLIDVVRAARALRPEGLTWPLAETGAPSFRLEELTKANGIHHEAAHDALSDVYATIALAKRIKTVQPRLFNFLWQHKGKHEAQQLLQLGSFTPVVHVSGMYPALKHCLAVVLPLCKHPTNANEIVVYDLSVDPEPLLTLSSEAIQYRLFTANADLPDNCVRIPLKTIHINKCPVIAPLSVLRPADAERLAIDLERCHVHAAQIKSADSLTATLAEVYQSRSYAEALDDPDLAIYSGGFFSEADRRLMQTVTTLSSEQLQHTTLTFKDQRLPQLLFRYRARNYPETLTAAEVEQWRDFCVARLTGTSASSIGLAAYLAKLAELRSSQSMDSAILDALEAFAAEKIQRFQLSGFSS